MGRYMLTTVDNPFNPFTDFKSWYGFDVASGYYTTDLLGRIVKTSDEISDADDALAIQQAIDEIVHENISGMHRKVSEEDFAST